MPHDDIDHIPSMVPTRDTDGPSPRSKQRSGKASSGSSRGGAGIWARLFITVALVVAAVACAWAWQLQEQLQQANHTMVRYERRISDLEARLSDTDEGLNQSSAAMAVKIKESNSEIRKLWDSRKKANNTMAAVDRRGRANTKKGEATAKSLATTAESLAAVRGQLATAAGDIAKLKSVAGDLERLMASAKVNQAEVERVADDLNRIKLSLAKTDKRVRSNEEWVESINAFRRQINKTVSDIQAGLVTLQKPVGQN